jgi:Flp pilus assembly protein TadD
LIALNDVRPERPARTAHSSIPSGIGRSVPASALNNRGFRLLRQGRAAEAEPLLREAVRRNPSHAYAQYNLGWSLLQQGKAREALGPLQRTASQQPSRWEPQHRLAQAYERLGQRERAQAASARERSLRAGQTRGRTTRRRTSAVRGAAHVSQGRSVSTSNDRPQGTQRRTRPSDLSADREYHWVRRSGEASRDSGPQ